MKILNDFVSNINVIEQQAFKNLRLHFLGNRQTQDLQIKTFDEAIEDKSLLITEVNENGSVPELKFSNRASLPVFIAEGSVVQGLKQSRAIRISFIIKQNQELHVPVHCVEQSRWTFKTRTGHKSPFHLYSRLRASNARHTSQSLREGRGFCSNSQSETWRNIRRKMQRMGIKSGTGFAGDIYNGNEESMNEYLRVFTCPDTATGLLAMIDEHVLGMDIFANEKLFRANFQPLLSGIVTEAIDKDFCESLQGQSVLTVRQFLQSIVDAEKESYQSVGNGKDVRFESKGVVGSALVNDNRLIHAEAFMDAV